MTKLKSGDPDGAEVPQAQKLAAVTAMLKSAAGRHKEMKALQKTTATAMKAYYDVEQELAKEITIQLNETLAPHFRARVVLYKEVLFEQGNDKK